MSLRAVTSGGFESFDLPALRGGEGRDAEFWDGALDGKKDFEETVFFGSGRQNSRRGRLEIEPVEATGRVFLTGLDDELFPKVGAAFEVVKAKLYISRILLVGNGKRMFGLIWTKEAPNKGW